MLSGTLVEPPSAPIVGAEPDHDGETDVFYGGIAIPTYTCAPYNDDEDTTDGRNSPDAYFEINADADNSDA